MDPLPALILIEAQHLLDRHRDDLARQARLMDARAWIGPSARRFDAELQHNHRALRSALTHAVDSLHALRTPLPGAVR